jgi:hypothetical protein
VSKIFDYAFVPRSFSHRVHSLCVVEMIDPDRAKLLLAAVAGALLGIVTGSVAGKPLLGIIIWALIGAVVVSGVVYCLRFFRR